MTKKLDIIVVGAAGRMGSLIARLVRDSPDLQLAGVVDTQANSPKLAAYNCPSGENLAAVVKPGAVVIDFTLATVALETARSAASLNLAAVIGTTGFDQTQKDELKALAARTPLLWSANMSVGVNVLQRLLPELVKALGGAYDVEMVELHHRHKKDAPSGTALMLAEGLARAKGWELSETRASCRDGLVGERKNEEIGVLAVRGGDVVGIHSTYFLGPGEIIEVKHMAESRENFANGALRAARWLASRKPGCLYSMQDVIFEEN